MNDKPIVELLRFKKEIYVRLNSEEDQMAKQAINKYYLGVKHCNKLVDGIMVSAYPEKETQQYIEANKNTSTTKLCVVEIALFSNGSFLIMGQS